MDKNSFIKWFFNLTETKVFLWFGVFWGVLITNAVIADYNHFGNIHIANWITLAIYIAIFIVHTVESWIQYRKY